MSSLFFSHLQCVIRSSSSRPTRSRLPRRPNRRWTICCNKSRALQDGRTPPLSKIQTHSALTLGSERGARFSRAARHLAVVVVLLAKTHGARKHIYFLAILLLLCLISTSIVYVFLFCLVRWWLHTHTVSCDQNPSRPAVLGGTLPTPQKMFHFFITYAHCTIACRTSNHFRNRISLQWSGCDGSKCSDSCWLYTTLRLFPRSI